MPVSHGWLNTLMGKWVNVLQTRVYTHINICVYFDNLN